VREERFEAVSQAGAKVVVLWRPDEAEVEVQVASKTYLPAWGSQACDDWLDWVTAQQRGEPVSLPVDEITGSSMRAITASSERLPLRLQAALS
jgi:hypothetical protein